MNIQERWNGGSYYRVFELADGRRFPVFPDEWSEMDFEIQSAIRDGLYPIRRSQAAAVQQECVFGEPETRLIGSHGGQHWQSASFGRRDGKISSVGLAMLDSIEKEFGRDITFTIGFHQGIQKWEVTTTDEYGEWVGTTYYESEAEAREAFALLNGNLTAN